MCCSPRAQDLHTTVPPRQTTSKRVIMSIQSLVPANIVAAMSTAVNTFKRFLASETVTIDGLNASILSDLSGACFVAVIEKIAMHLAYLRGGNGEFLAKNSVISYYRQVKKWLLGFFASQKANVDDKLLGMARTLEKHCMTKVKDGLVKKATACKKGDLKLLMEHIYLTATSVTDYQDAALVCLIVRGRCSQQSLKHGTHACVLRKRSRLGGKEEEDLRA